VPHLDWLARTFDVSLAAAGFAVSCVMLPGAAAGWTFGAIVDRFGAKRVAVGGLLLAGAASAASGFTASFAVLVFVRIIEGVGYTLLVVAATVLIARHGAIGLSVWSSFAPIGFALGQWAGSYAKDPLFDAGVGHAAVLALAAVAVRLFATEVPAGRTAGQASALRHAPALRSALAFGGVCLVLLAAVALAPVVLAKAQGRTIAEIASLTALAALPSIIGRVIPGWLLERGAHALTIFVVAAAVAAATIAGALLLPAPLWAALVLFAIFQISAGTLPGLLSAMMPHVAPTPAQLGTVSGMCSQAVNIGNLVGPPLVLAVYASAGTTTAVNLLVGLLAVSLAAIAGLAVFRRNLRQAA
jgi:MFS family permease